MSVALLSMAALYRLLPLQKELPKIIQIAASDVTLVSVGLGWRLQVSEWNKKYTWGCEDRKVSCPHLCIFLTTSAPGYICHFYAWPRDSGEAAGSWGAWWEALRIFVWKKRALIFIPFSKAFSSVRQSYRSAEILIRVLFKSNTVSQCFPSFVIICFIPCIESIYWLSRHCKTEPCALVMHACYLHKRAEVLFMIYFTFYYDSSCRLHF